MNFKTTYILFAVLALFVGVFAVVLWYQPTAADKSATYALSALHQPNGDIKPEDIDRVEIERREPKQEKIVLQRDSDTNRWSMVEPRKLRAEKAVVTGLIRQVFEASREENLDKAPNLAAWGLETSQATITLKKAIPSRTSWRSARRPPAAPTHCSTFSIPRGRRSRWASA